MLCFVMISHIWCYPHWNGETHCCVTDLSLRTECFTLSAWREVSYSLVLEVLSGCGSLRCTRVILCLGLEKTDSAIIFMYWSLFSFFDTHDLCSDLLSGRYLLTGVRSFLHSCFYRNDLYRQSPLILFR